MKGYLKWMAAVLMGLMLLSGCGGQEAAQTPPEAPLAEPEQEAEEVLPPEGLVEAWACVDPESGIQSRLILGEDSSAQLLRLDSVGNLLDLAWGTWRWTQEAQLALELTVSAEEGVFLEEEPPAFAGTYPAQLEEGVLTVWCPNGTLPLFPGHEEAPGAYVPLGSLPENQPGLDAETEERLCRAAMEYYASSHEGYRPGVILVDSVEEEGVRVHLYDDMGTHTATCAWYLIDPETLQGQDEIFGDPIDFSAFAD